MGVGAGPILLLIFVSLVAGQAPRISKIDPTFGSISGGGSVTVTGSGFTTVGTFKCRFGLNSNSAGNLDRATNSLVCPIPKNTFIGPVPFSVSADNGVTYSNSLTFQYRGATPVISSLEPNVSVSSGGTTITVSGANFATGFSPQCLFGTVSVTPKIWTSQVATCVSPSFKEAKDLTLDFKFTNDGLTFSNILKFRVAVPTPTLTTINPGKGFKGVSLTLNGGNLISSNTSGCLIGGSYVPAKLAKSASSKDPSGYRVICPVPTLNNTRNRPRVEVRYSNDGVTFSNPLSFLYVDPSPLISELRPSRGALDSETSITIIGSDFVDSGALSCLFGSYPATQATVVPNSKGNAIVCKSPKTGVQIDLKVRVSNDGTQLLASNSLLFSFERQSLITAQNQNPQVPPNITSVNPEYAPLTGGTKVTITGTGFIDSDRLECNFGLPGANAGVRAQLVVFKDNQQITCVVPAAPNFMPVLTILQVTNDKLSYSNFLAFRYINNQQPLI
eukprot:TRINITY_DN4821_c0_g1_i1.p1 TRINITY_DN4821_c0_g1~~TRINITY_DN4821_c0_g1_i1.p1  ORF type:complete len:502 (+),score=145.81 TRINITY_DN4821_c0_g1_i1:42-1547(+)